MRPPLPYPSFLIRAQMSDGLSLLVVTDDLALPVNCISRRKLTETVMVAIIAWVVVFAALTRKYNFGSGQEIIRLFANVLFRERESSLLAWSPYVAKHPHRVVSKWPVIRQR